MKGMALAVFFILGFIVIAAGPAMATHIEATYRVAPESSSGPTGMTVCLRFNADSIPGNLEVDLSPPADPLTRFLTWEHQDLGTDLHTFMAVTMEDDPSLVDFMIFGKFKGSSSLRQRGPISGISGEYLDESGVTLNFRGEQVKSCTPGP
jgi:hypothetical protein